MKNSGLEQKTTNLHQTDINISEIKNEYTKIDYKWLYLHFKTTVILVVFAFVVECVMAFFIINSDMLNTSVNAYVWKFVLLPGGINFACLFIDYRVMKSPVISLQRKTYTVSLLLVMICFILFTAHNAFITTFYFFAVAIMLTMIYADYKLTSITALCSVAALLISELFIVWDVDKQSIFTNTLRMGNFIIAIMIMLASSIAAMAVINYEKKKNIASIEREIERKELQKIIQVDEMTGLFNQKALHEALRNVESQAQFDDDYVFVITDIDNFKFINDKYGHHLGDQSLCGFADTLKANCQDGSCYRYGGDEFCLLFHQRTLDEVVAVCEGIRDQLRVMNCPLQPELQLTASFGIAKYNRMMSAVKLFVHADIALYDAKIDRDKICIFTKEDNDRSV